MDDIGVIREYDFQLKNSTTKSTLSPPPRGIADWGGGVILQQYCDDRDADVAFEQYGSFYH